MISLSVPVLTKMKIIAGAWRQPLKNCAHGPQRWPWWRLFHIGISKLTVHKPSSGYAFWFYSRRGASYIDVFFDRRSLVEGKCWCGRVHF
jgi:hypothetical protein